MRCPVCGWAMYDGGLYCQKPGCSHITDEDNDEPFIKITLRGFDKEGFHRGVGGKTAMVGGVYESDLNELGFFRKP